MRPAGPDRLAHVEPGTHVVRGLLMSSPSPRAIWQTEAMAAKPTAVSAQGRCFFAGTKLVRRARLRHRAHAASNGAHRL